MGTVTFSLPATLGRVPTFWKSRAALALHTAVRPVVDYSFENLQLPVRARMTALTTRKACTLLSRATTTTGYNSGPRVQQSQRVCVKWYKSVEHQALCLGAKFLAGALFHCQACRSKRVLLLVYIPPVLDGAAEQRGFALEDSTRGVRVPLGTLQVAALTMPQQDDYGHSSASLNPRALRCHTNGAVEMRKFSVSPPS